MIAYAESRWLPRAMDQVMERYVLKWKGMEARAALVLAIFHSLVIFFAHFTISANWLKLLADLKCCSMEASGDKAYE